MENNHSKEHRYILAKKRVEKIKGFYIHTLITVLILPFLIFFNLRFSPQFHWFWFPIFGMGLGLLLHWLDVYGPSFLLGKKWEERKLKELMDNEKF